MSWAAKQRREHVLNHEGQILALSGQHGADNAASYARCVVDGGMNALIRLEGREKASVFVFGVADRVAGGLREPTKLFPASPDPTPKDAEIAVEPLPPPTSEPRPSESAYRWAVVIALVAGALIGKLWL